MPEPGETSAIQTEVQRFRRSAPRVSRRPGVFRDVVDRLSKLCVPFAAMDIAGCASSFRRTISQPKVADPVACVSGFGHAQFGAKGSGLP